MKKKGSLGQSGKIRLGEAKNFMSSPSTICIGELQ